MDVRDHGLPRSAQAGNDHGSAGAQVARPDFRAVQALHAVDDGRAAVHVRVRAHAAKLLNVLVAIVIHALGHEARAVGQTQRHADLRLHIRREAGIRLGLDAGGTQAAVAAHEHAVPALDDGDAHLAQLGADALQMARDHVR